MTRTNAQKSRSRANATRGFVGSKPPSYPPGTIHIMGAAGRKGGAKRKRNRTQRGLLASLGGMLLPGIGNGVGQFADNIVGDLLGGLLGGKASSAPLASAGRVKTRQVNTSHEHGVEEIAVLTVPAGTPAGTVLLQSLIAAPEIGVRLAQFAPLWTRTMFNRFVVRVTSSNPATVGGNYTLAIDPDPVQSYPSGAEIPARLMALTMAERANAWADVELQMTRNPILLFNKFNPATASDAELREYAVGQLLIATTTDYPDDCTYTVNVEWDVTFQRPDTNPEFYDRTYYGNFTGADVATISTPTTSFTFLANDVSAAFGGKPPPPGTYEQPAGVSFFTRNATGTSLNNPRVMSVTIASDGGATFKSTGPSMGNLAVADVITSQQPPMMRFDSPNLSLIGYAKVHPLKVTNQQEWYERSIELNQTKAMEKAIFEAEKAAVAQFRKEEVLRQLYSPT